MLSTLLICPNECSPEFLDIEYHPYLYGTEDGYVEAVCSACGWDAIVVSDEDVEGGYSVEELIDPIPMLPSRSDNMLMEMAWDDYLVHERLEYFSFDLLD